MWAIMECDFWNDIQYVIDMQYDIKHIWNVFVFLIYITNKFLCNL